MDDGREETAISEALKLLKSSGKTARQIERNLAIIPGLLVKWRDLYQVILQEAEHLLSSKSDREPQMPIHHRLHHSDMVFWSLPEFTISRVHNRF